MFSKFIRGEKKSPGGRRFIGRGRRTRAKFRRLTSEQVWLLVNAAWWLLIARAALRILPFPSLASRLGEFVAPDTSSTSVRRCVSDPNEAAVAEKIRWAVGCAAQNVPFQAVCFPQALAASIMLQRRGVSSTLHFGAAKAGIRGMDAHVWLEAAGVEVTGYPVASGFIEIGCFMPQPATNQSGK
jgi:hypothetical protein